LKSYETEHQKEITSAPSEAERGKVEQELRNGRMAAEEQESGDSHLIVLESGSSDSAVEEYEEESIERPRRWNFSPPNREQLLNWLPFWGVILLGAVLRFWGLGDKPLHHDESLHAYFSLQLLHNNIQNWASCFRPNASCYRYDPLLHGPFQFHAIALVYQICQWLGVYDHGVNTFTVRIAAATLGTVIVALPYFLRDYIGKVGAWLACFLLAVSPSMVYFSRFAREDIYMACFTLLLVVAVGRYVRERKMRWIVIAGAAFALSYATKEATFLSIAIFGSFLGALLAWEIGAKWPIRVSVGSDAAFAKYLPSNGAPIALVLYFLILAPIAKVFFSLIKALSIYVTDPKNTPAADLYVQRLKDTTVAIVPWIGIILGVYVLSILAREMFGKLPLPGRHGIAARIDPERQPLLDTIFTMQWTHWFFALLCGWTIFLVLFTALFTNIRGGIGDGVWQGLYYWLEQQQVARGGQPWYYYLLLIPLYEQIGVVFGLIGLIRCIVFPNRFRLFLAYWFVGNLFIYSWAAEKMPWLMIHITMPLMLLAAIGLEPVVVTLINWVRGWLARSRSAALTTAEVSSVPLLVPPTRAKVGVAAGSFAITGFVLAVLLLLPTLHNMYEVSYVHAADGPHEMMVYVQTTTDVNIVMAKVDALDQKLYGGKHLLPIGLMDDATWPFAWYLRDYTNVCYSFPSGCQATAKNIPVIIVGGDNLYSAQSQYATNTKNGAGYLFHQYQMRTWWDEGYKPPPCVPSKTNNCDGQSTWGGVGPGLWLSYGDNPPPGAKFNAVLAAKRIWQWWWDRVPFGSTDGAYGMGLLIRSDLGVQP
jgi:predicted membrane-bound mannosyltransferase